MQSLIRFLAGISTAVIRCCRHRANKVARRLGIGSLPDESHFLSLHPKTNKALSRFPVIFTERSQAYVCGAVCLCVYGRSIIISLAPNLCTLAGVLTDKGDWLCKVIAGLKNGPCDFCIVVAKGLAPSGLSLTDRLVNGTSIQDIPLLDAESLSKISLCAQG